MMSERQEERSLGELFSELARQTSTLVRQEVELAKTEMTQKATNVGKDVGVIGVGGAIAYAGLLGIMAGLILVLGQLIPLWLSALIVGVVFAGIGYIMIQRGISGLKHTSLTPTETIETLKEDKEWVKQQTK